MVSWATVAVLAFVGALGAACCVAAARAFFGRRADRVAYRMVGAWAAAFGLTLAACLVAKDAFGVSAAALAAAAACALAFSLLPLAARWQRTRAMAAAVAYVQLHRLSSAPASEGSDAARLDLEMRCARLARSYDLTRREEDVLRLLMEGRTFSEVADELVVSVNTVKSHVRRVYAKMGVAGKQDLLDKALR